jgi:CubicO group peptidase (beta-lactamase class C family)
MLLNDHPVWRPGDKASYSNYGYTLLGYALEVITGKPFDEILHKRITQPLGLNSTSFDLPPLSRGIIPQGMQSYDLDLGNYKAQVQSSWDHRRRTNSIP